MKTFFVYIIKCSDNTYYTRMTNNINRRWLEHCYSEENKEAYTYNRKRLELVFYETFNDVKQAFEFERKLKKWSRLKKEALINKNWNKLKELSVCRNQSHYKFKDKK